MKKLLLLLLVCVPAVLSAQKKQYPNIDIPFKKYVLDNGLTLIVHEDHKVPLAAFDIWYHVGSKNEKPGKTGFAHLFEHIMFTSTEHWKNFDEVMQTVGGGNNNGTTNNDRTNYFETFSKTGLDRVLWLEADRMGYLLNGLDSAKVNVQRGVVQNEKRQGDNQPYAIMEELTVKSTYPAGHPYSWSVIGSLDDLSAASLTDVKDWFKEYYGPNNAIVSIAGDVNADEVYEKVKKYFSDIPASPPIAKHTAWVAKMTGTHTQVVQDRVPQARLQKLWNVPQWGTKDVNYLDLLSSVLTTGKSSRLYKRLVYDEQLASSVFSGVDDREIGSQFYIGADAKPGVSVDKINKIINEELQKVLTTGVTETELERAKTSYFVSFLNGIEHSGGFGGTNDILSQSQTFGGSPDFYKTIQGWIKAATPADIKKSAQDWLSDGEYVLKVLPYGNYTNTDSKLDRSVMPAAPTPPAAKFPAIKQFTLANGLKVYLAEQHSVPVVNIITSFNAGYSADKDAPGLASLTGKVMAEGTTTKTSTQISDLLSDLGSSFRVSNSIDFTYASMRALKSNLNASLALYADLLLHPSFPQKDFERVQKQTVLGIQQEKANPNALGLRILPALIYGAGHAYSNPLTGTGTEASVQKLTRASLSAFHDTWFAPNNANVVVVGDVTEAELKTQLETAFAGWKAHPVPTKNIGEVAPISKPVVYMIDKPGASQSIIYAAELAPSGSAPNQEAMRMMNNVLGGTFLSRLNMNLREDKHWSYGAGSRIYKTQGPGLFYAYGPVQTDKTKESTVEIQKELNQILKKKPVGDDEFKNELNSVILSLPGDWETNSGVLGFLLDIVQYGKGTAYAENYAGILQKLTVNDIRDAANTVVKPNQLTWLIVGDREKIEKGIRDLDIGTIKFLDTDGKEIK
ncbi:insulinase family protein [Inquilinus sp. KBS0705]|nr:insulinase family protein [Inquilinus sp. KBS0705]